MFKHEVELIETHTTRAGNPLKKVVISTPHRGKKYIIKIYNCGKVTVNQMVCGMIIYKRDAKYNRKTVKLLLDIDLKGV